MGLKTGKWICPEQHDYLNIGGSLRVLFSVVQLRVSKSLIRIINDPPAQPLGEVSINLKLSEFR
jgi:hypothetical protein